MLSDSQLLYCSLTKALKNALNFFFFLCEWIKAYLFSRLLHHRLPSMPVALQQTWWWSIASRQMPPSSSVLAAMVSSRTQSSSPSPRGSYLPTYCPGVLLFFLGWLCFVSVRASLFLHSHIDFLNCEFLSVCSCCSPRFHCHGHAYTHCLLSLLFFFVYCRSLVIGSDTSSFWKALPLPRSILASCSQQQRAGFSNWKLSLMFKWQENT